MRQRIPLVLLLLLLAVLAFWTGRATSPEGPPTPGASGAASTAPTIWTCSMHPQVRLPEPGQCPICFMDLIPASSDEAAEPDGAPRLRLSERARALAEIETAPVERRSVAREVEMVGKVALDETRVADITSWVAGRLDRLFVDSTGVSVRAHDHLVEIYSPTLYAAQQELLQAIATAERLEGSSLEILGETADRTVVSAREKLRLYGLSDARIEAIVERGRPSEVVTIDAPIGGVVVQKDAREGMYVQEGTRIYTIADLSKVWVLLDAYETDLAWLRYGQDVEFRVQAYPGEIFHGRVAFIAPLLDDHTRTVKVRLNVENAGLRLKPEMFVSATAQAVLTSHGKVVDEALAGQWMCPMHPEVVAAGEGSCSECGMDLVPAAELGFVSEPERGESLVVPASAPLVTGKRAVVYVRVPGEERPTYEGREVALGPRAGDWYVVRDGLAEGEEVVVRGNFKIDSELQIRARPSMMSVAGEEPRSQAVEPSDELREGLVDVTEAYLALQVALAADEEGAEEAAVLRKSLARLEPGELAGAARERWAELATRLEGGVAALARARDVEARRVAFEPLSIALIEALETFAVADAAQELGVFHCPMALDGAGADWLQAGEATANPYYGSAMLRCGSRTRRLRGGE